MSRVDLRFVFSVATISCVMLFTQIQPLVTARALSGAVERVEGRVKDVQRGTKTGTTTFEYQVGGQTFVGSEPWLVSAAPGQPIEVTYAANDPSIASIDVTRATGRLPVAQSLSLLGAFGLIACLGGTMIELFARRKQNRERAY